MATFDAFRQLSGGRQHRCEVCSINFPSEYSYNVHVKGMVHMQNVINRGAAAKPALAKSYSHVSSAVKTNVTSATEKVSYTENFCPLCSLKCSGRVSFIDHLTGKKHEDAVKNAWVHRIPVAEYLVPAHMRRDAAPVQQQPRAPPIPPPQSMPPMPRLSPHSLPPQMSRGMPPPPQRKRPVSPERYSRRAESPPPVKKAKTKSAQSLPSTSSSKKGADDGKEDALMRKVLEQQNDLLLGLLGQVATGKLEKDSVGTLLSAIGQPLPAGLMSKPKPSETANKPTPPLPQLEDTDVRKVELKPAPEMKPTQEFKIPPPPAVQTQPPPGFSTQPSVVVSAKDTKPEGSIQATVDADSTERQVFIREPKKPSPPPPPRPVMQDIGVTASFEEKVISVSSTTKDTDDRFQPKEATSKSVSTSFDEKKPVEDKDERHQISIGVGTDTDSEAFLTPSDADERKFASTSTTSPPSVVDDKPTDLPFQDTDERQVVFQRGGMKGQRGARRGGGRGGNRGGWQQAQQKEKWHQKSKQQSWQRGNQPGKWQQGSGRQNQETDVQQKPRQDQAMREGKRQNQRQQQPVQQENRGSEAFPPQQQLVIENRNIGRDNQQGYPRLERWQQQQQDNRNQNVGRRLRDFTHQKAEPPAPQPQRNEPQQVMTTSSPPHRRDYPPIREPRRRPQETFNRGGPTVDDHWKPRGFENVHQKKPNTGLAFRRSPPRKRSPPPPPDLKKGAPSNRRPPLPVNIPPPKESYRKDSREAYRRPPMPVSRQAPLKKSFPPPHHQTHASRHHDTDERVQKVSDRDERHRGPPQRKSKSKQPTEGNLDKDYRSQGQGRRKARSPTPPPVMLEAPRDDRFCAAISRVPLIRPGNPILGKAWDLANPYQKQFIQFINMLPDLVQLMDTVPTEVLQGLGVHMPGIVMAVQHFYINELPSFRANLIDPLSRLSGLAERDHLLLLFIASRPTVVPEDIVSSIQQFIVIETGIALPVAPGMM